MQEYRTFYLLVQFMIFTNQLLLSFLQLFNDFFWPLGNFFWMNSNTAPKTRSHGATLVATGYVTDLLHDVTNSTIYGDSNAGQRRWRKLVPNLRQIVLKSFKDFVWVSTEFTHLPECLSFYLYIKHGIVFSNRMSDNSPPRQLAPDYSPPDI